MNASTGAICNEELKSRVTRADAIRQPELQPEVFLVNSLPHRVNPS